MKFSDIIVRLPETALTEVPDLPWPRIGSGKVREIFDLGDRLLLVATDRISAFDVILPQGVPGKGVILTQMSRFWFDETRSIVPNHLLPDQDDELESRLRLPAGLPARSMVVRKLRPLPIECVVRGYLAGGGWESYRESGSICGIPLPKGLRQADRLPDPIFTPTTKAAKGSHDEPVDAGTAGELLGAGLFERVRDLSIQIYRFGHDRAEQAGMILADTKFEFGVSDDGSLFLIDEVLTPDSSRFWPRDEYEPGRSPPSFDKQFVRDYLSGLVWDKQPPPPPLPPAVVSGTQSRYLQALHNLLVPPSGN